MHDILIKNGTIVDPSQNLHGTKDISISNRKIDSIEDSIDESKAHQVINADGLIVTPGLIDLHAVSYTHLTLPTNREV